MPNVKTSRVAALMLLLITSGCGREVADQKVAASDSPPPAEVAGAPAPPNSGHGAEVHHFEDLDTMVATARAVVIGRVVETRRGPVLGDPGYELTLREVVIEVEDLLAGEAPPRLVQYELGWSSNGAATEANNVAGSAVGDRGFYFLAPAEGRDDLVQPSFVLLNSQGRYLTEDGETLAPANADDAFSKELASRGFAGLRAAVRDSAERVKAGEATPASTAPPRSHQS